MKIKVAGQTLNITGEQFIRRVEAGEGEDEWEYRLNGVEMMKLAHGTELIVILERLAKVCNLEEVTVTNTPCFDEEGNPLWKNRTICVGDNMKFLRPPPYAPCPERWINGGKATGINLICADPPFNTGKTWKGK